MRAYFLTPRARDGFLGIVDYVEDQLALRSLTASSVKSKPPSTCWRGTPTSVTDATT